jgi:Rrf2 family nitric oxide-sensitive transcriptional repressor
MRLTSYSNYTVRVLMVAAARSPLLTTVQHVADGFAISRSHLVKCVHQLGSWGYLRLARPAETIPLGEVIRRTEETFAIVECFEPKTNTCPFLDHCRLRQALEKATEAFLAVLDGLSIADITDNGDELLSILSLRGPRDYAERHCIG